MEKLLSTLKIVFSIVIVTIIFILEITLVTNVILNKFVNEDNLAEIIEEIISKNDDNKILITLADTKTTGSISSNKVDFKSIEGRIKNYLTNVGFTKEEAAQIVNDEEFKNVVNNYLESVLLSEIKDTEIRYPTKAEIQKFIQKNYNALKKIKVISEKYNENTIDKFVEENYDDVKNKLEEIVKEVKIPEIKEVSYLKKIININPFVLGIMIAILALFLVLLRPKYKWLVWFSIPTFLVGLLFSTLGLFGIKLITSLTIFDNYNELITPIAKKMSTMMIRYGIITIVITIVLLIIYLIIRNKTNNEEKKSIKK